MGDGGEDKGVGRVDHAHGLGGGLPPGLAKKLDQGDEDAQGAQGAQGAGITININFPQQNLAGANPQDKAQLTPLAQNANAGLGGTPNPMLDALNNFLNQPAAKPAQPANLPYDPVTGLQTAPTDPKPPYIVPHQEDRLL